MRRVGNKKVAVKVQRVIPEYETDVTEEYKILKYLASHPNLPAFYGAYYKKGEVWFVMQVKYLHTLSQFLRNPDAELKKRYFIVSCARAVASSTSSGDCTNRIDTCPRSISRTY